MPQADQYSSAKLQRCSHDDSKMVPIVLTDLCAGRVVHPCNRDLVEVQTAVSTLLSAKDLTALADTSSAAGTGAIAAWGIAARLVAKAACCLCRTLCSTPPGCGRSRMM